MGIYQGHTWVIYDPFWDPFRGPKRVQKGVKKGSKIVQKGVKKVSFLDDFGPLFGTPFLPLLALLGTMGPRGHTSG